MYKICATKRDLDTIDRKLYQFIPDLWEVVMSTGTYQLKYEDAQYNLYSNGVKTTLFISNISLIRGCVYEGQWVTVNSEGNSTQMYFGTLKRATQDGEKAIPKSVVFSESQCSLKSPSQEYVDNRLVREEDIIRPEQVSVYYDHRYLSIEHVKTNGLDIAPSQFIPEYIERFPGDNMSSEVQKTQACNAITCSKGDRVVVTKKEGVEYDIVINKVTDYSSLETVLVNDSDTLEFDVNQTVFIEFQIPISTYTLYTHCGEIHIGPASVTVKSTIDGTTTTLLHGECNEFDDYSVTSVPIQVQPQKVVKIEVEATCSNEIGAPLVYSPSIRNLITNLELSKTDISSNSETWVGTFTMPEADCLVSPKLKYIYHDGDQEDINPVFFLTVKSSDLASVVVNDIEYDISDGPITIPCDVANLNWELLDGYTSKVDIYSTDTPSTIFHTEVGFITNYDFVLSSNTTIEISLQQVDCKYTSFRGKIDSLDKGKKWNASNSILDAQGNVPYKTYYVDTNVQIADSGEPNHFEGTEVEEIVFYNPTNSFYIWPKAFKKCEHLQSIDLSKASNIRVKEEAFWNSFSLSDFKNTQAISELGEYSFTNTGLPGFIYGSNLLQIPNYTFMDCRDLADVNYESTSSLESVGRLAFDDCRKLKHAVFPVSLSKIGDQCFGENAFSAVHTSPAYCTRTITDSASCVFNVDSFEFKNGMTELPEYAFEYCKNIKEIYLPASINLIKKGAFFDCDNIKHFMSPGLEIVEEEAFGNTWIEGTESAGLQLVVDGTTDYDLYKLPGTTGILFDTATVDLGGVNSSYTVCTYISPKEDNSRLILYKCNEKQTWPSILSDGGRYRYQIHHNTISISPYAFSGNYDFGNIGCLDNTVDYQLKYIGRNAFKDNNLITTFKFPKNGTVTYLGPGAFQGCTRLSEVYNFKQQPITRIEEGTFYNCGDNKYGIGASTDAGYCNLDFYIPDTTTSIGDYAFAKCPQLMGIANLANCNITSIGEGAFQGCFQNTAWQAAENKRISLLVAGIVMAAVGSIATLGTTALALTGGTISLVIEWSASTAGFVGGAMGTTLGGLVIADNDDATKPQGAELWLPKVTNIGKAAFKDCSYLTTVIVSDELTTIAADTFNSCSRLHNLQGVPSTYNFGDTEDVYTSLQVTYIGERAFKGCKNLSMHTMAHLLRSIKVIGNDAFLEANLHEGMLNRQIIIPNSIRILGDHSLHLDNLYENHTRDWVFIHQDPTQIVRGTDVFPSKHINIHIPAGSLNNYLQAFPNLTSDKFTEIDLNDQFWHKLKEAGYSVPWIND